VRCGERGKRLAGVIRGREAEIVRDARQVRVARVDLIPDVIEPARLDVSRHERGLARATRPGDPNDLARETLIEPLEQPLARDQSARGRPRDLGGQGLSRGRR
jgi:hypothetical protein